MLIFIEPGFTKANKNRQYLLRHFSNIKSFTMNSNMHFQYYNSNALVVVNTKGQIRTLYKSFRVKCVEAVGLIPRDAHAYVDEVLSNDLDQLQYVINGQLYLYYQFHLCIKF